MTSAHTQDPDIIHSTLLHRVASRDIKNKPEILAYLWKHTPNPTRRTQSQKTAAMMANDFKTRELLEQWTSAIEAKILRQELFTQKHSKSQAKKRL